MKYASLLHVIYLEQYNFSHNFVMIIMNAMQHHLNGESATNSQRGSPSPILHEESKERLKKEYIRRVKKCLKSKLNGGNNYGKGDQHLGCVANEVQCGNC